MNRYWILDWITYLSQIRFSTFIFSLGKSPFTSWIIIKLNFMKNTHFELSSLLFFPTKWTWRNLLHLQETSSLKLQRSKPGKNLQFWSVSHWNKIWKKSFFFTIITEGRNFVEYLDTLFNNQFSLFTLSGKLEVGPEFSSPYFFNSDDFGETFQWARWLEVSTIKL